MLSRLYLGSTNSSIDNDVLTGLAYVVHGTYVYVTTVKTSFEIYTGVATNNVCFRESIDSELCFVRVNWV